MNGRKRIEQLTSILLGLVLAAFAFKPVLAQAPSHTGSAPAPAASISTSDVPFYTDWASSPHADRSAEPFNHWNKGGKVPVPCARCHSTPGFREYVGADGTPAGTITHPAPIGTVIACVACHNNKTIGLDAVTFRSGLTVTGLGANAICMTCHQGAESMKTVDQAVAGMADDVVQPKLEFINVHYAAAGATLMGKLAGVAYEYPGKTYAGRRIHAEPYTTCTACHETHTVAVKVSACKTCHSQVTDKASLRLIRMSSVDYAGSGKANEGVADEIKQMSDRLYAAIQAYAKTVAGKPIVYAFETHPYFFVDTNGNGVPDKDEAKFDNRYKAWTPRLMKAAFNYQFVRKEPGAYAHNPTYALQILYDSIADLGTKVAVDNAAAKRP